jgi:hypothetical protein
MKQRTMCYDFFILICSMTYSTLLFYDVLLAIFLDVFFWKIKTKREIIYKDIVIVFIFSLSFFFLNRSQKITNKTSLNIHDIIEFFCESTNVHVYFFLNYILILISFIVTKRNYSRLFKWSNCLSFSKLDR